MRGAKTLVPARFLTLLSHFCVLVILIWNSEMSVKRCMPIQHSDDQFQTYHTRFSRGIAASLTLLLFEFVTFILGATMFSGSVSVTSIGSHGLASIVLSYFILAGWNCDWFWSIFVMSTILPFCADIVSAIESLLFA